MSKILNLIKKSNGIITTSTIIKAGFSRGNLTYLVNTGKIERVSRGVYTLPDIWEDELFNIQNKYKRGIFSLNTALFLCDLTDRTPMAYQMTFPSTYNLTNPKKDNILCSGAKEPFYSMGLVELTTPSGNKVKSYNIEKTLCDILRPKNHIDIQIITNAFKKYINKTEKNIPLLSKYAKELKVSKQLRAYLEVLL